MTLRLVGTCPVCERQQKVTPAGAMVHHGFRRPGTGSIHGDCFGVGFKAYELSSEGCAAYQEMLASWLQGAEMQLARYRSRPEKINTEPNFRGQIATYHRDDPDREKRHRYEKTLEDAIRRAQYMIGEFRREDQRMLRLIQAWAPAPLLEIDEEGLTPAKREERAERKAERDAKRAEKDRKRHELQKKRNERFARKATTLLFFFDEFERLRAMPPSSERTAYARDLIFESQKKKYGLSYPHDLFFGPDDGYGNRMRGPWGRGTVEHAQRTLLDLGLAREEQIHGRPFFEVIPVYRSHGNKIQVPEPNGPADEVLDTVAHMAPPT